MGFKAGKSGTPLWLYSDLGLPLYKFDQLGCATEMTLADPTDPLYADRYADFLRAVGAHIRLNPAHFRALADVKPSGAN